MVLVLASGTTNVRAAQTAYRLDRLLKKPGAYAALSHPGFKKRYQALKKNPDAKLTRQDSNNPEAHRLARLLLNSLYRANLNGGGEDVLLAELDRQLDQKPALTGTKPAAPETRIGTEKDLNERLEKALAADQEDPGYLYSALEIIQASAEILRWNLLESPDAKISDDLIVRASKAYTQTIAKLPEVVEAETKGASGPRLEALLRMALKIQETLVSPDDYYALIAQINPEHFAGFTNIEARKEKFGDGTVRMAEGLVKLIRLDIDLLDGAEGSTF